VVVEDHRVPDLTGNTYEQLTGRIVSELEQSGAVDTSELTRRKIVAGRTTQHEIDVWWVFDWSGRRYTIAFQCKDWARSVEQGELLKFQAVLADLAAYDPYGVFVTRTGYQAGSLNVASGNRISLLELREPIEKDWVGRVRTIELEIRAVMPAWRDYQIELPPGTADPATGLVTGSNEDLIVNEPGNAPQSILQLQQRLALPGFEHTEWQRRSLTFAPGTWLSRSDDPELRLPIAGLSAEARQTVTGQTITIEGTPLVRHVLTNVLTGTVVAYGADGRPLPGGVGLAALDLQQHNKPTTS